MRILGIESTCDETAAAIVENGTTILGQAIASSADIHQRYGGVFPELACRRHIDAIIPVIDEALRQSHTRPEDLDAIAIARGPGLIGALLIGLQAAKGLSIAWNKPLIGVNHTEAHLYAAMMHAQPPFPALGLVLSGGHTLMLQILGIGHYKLIGTTVDDSIGEAFDKVAALLGLTYPGGPALENLAKQGDEKKYPFRAGQVKKNPLAFSFSGLKTAVLYAVRASQPADYPDIASSFQRAALTDLANKAEKALAIHPAQAIVFGGGVTNNQRLRSVFAQRFATLPLYWPPAGLSTDNAAMIAGLAYHQYKSGLESDINLEPFSRLPFWDQNTVSPKHDSLTLPRVPHVYGGKAEATLGCK
jgi:N6-L-threonylcarbamoyladenine synthase